MTVEKSNTKPTVCVDLDGVLAKYDGWKGIRHIGEPIDGAAWMMRKLKEKYRVLVFTTRTKGSVNCTGDEATSTVPDLIEIVGDWLDKHAIPYDGIYSGQGKPLAVAYIDDRAVHCRPQEDEGAYQAALRHVKELADHAG